MPFTIPVLYETSTYPQTCLYCKPGMDHMGFRDPSYFIRFKTPSTQNLCVTLKRIIFQVSSWPCKLVSPGLWRENKTEQTSHSQVGTRPPRFADFSFVQLHKKDGLWLVGVPLGAYEGRRDEHFDKCPKLCCTSNSSYTSIQVISVIWRTIPGLQFGVLSQIRFRKLSQTLPDSARAVPIYTPLKQNGSPRAWYYLRLKLSQIWSKMMYLYVIK